MAESDGKRTIDAVQEALDGGLDLKAALIDLKNLSDQFASDLLNGLKAVAVEGRKLEDVLKSVALSMSQNLLNQALKPLQTLLSQGFANLAQGLASSLFGGPLNLLSLGNIKPFAKGGVIATPTYFPLGSHMGLAGEAGAEAILPLARGSDGRLGVRTSRGPSAPTVTFNIATPDVESFRRSETQLAALLARAVGRGRRGL